MRYRIKGEGGRRKGDECYGLPEIDSEVLLKRLDYSAFYGCYRSKKIE
jgi:hypothetical protein